MPRYPAARIPDGEARNWAMAAHLSPLVAGLIGLPFLGPLIIWLAKRDDHPYVAEQAREALNFNLSWLIYAVVGGFMGGLLMAFTWGIAAIVVVPVMIAAWIAWFVLMIVAAVRAANGAPYRYPLTMRMVR